MADPALVGDQGWDFYRSDRIYHCTCVLKAGSVAPKHLSVLYKNPPPRNNSVASCQWRWLFQWQVLIVKYGASFSLTRAQPFPGRDIMNCDASCQLAAARVQMWGDREWFGGAYRDSAADGFSFFLCGEGVGGQVGWLKTYKPIERVKNKNNTHPTVIIGQIREGGGKCF